MAIYGMSPTEIWGASNQIITMKSASSALNNTVTIDFPDFGSTNIGFLAYQYRQHQGGTYHKSRLYSVACYSNTTGFSADVLAEKTSSNGYVGDFSVSRPDANTIRFTFNGSSQNYSARHGVIILGTM